MVLKALASGDIGMCQAEIKKSFMQYFKCTYSNVISEMEFIITLF